MGLTSGEPRSLASAGRETMTMFSPPVEEQPHEWDELSPILQLQVSHGPLPIQPTNPAEWGAHLAGVPTSSMLACRPRGVESRGCFVYTSEPLEQDNRVTGYVMLTYGGTTGANTDWTGSWWTFIPTGKRRRVRRHPQSQLQGFAGVAVSNSGR